MSTDQPTDSPAESPSAAAADQPQPAPGQPPRKIRIGSQRPAAPTYQTPAPKIIPAAPAPPPADEADDAPPVAEPRPRRTAAAPTPVPSKRAQLSDEMLAEYEAALGDLALEQSLAGDSSVKAATELEPETRLTGVVAKLFRDMVFVDLGVPQQGVVQLKNFAEPPAVGSQLNVVVQRFDAEEGLYLLGASGATVNVADWSQVSEGALVEARITGHNKGGLECEVGRLKGFVPAGQISLYRVEDFAEFVGQRLVCVVTEADPDRRNLVLSRRAVLEREKAEAKAKLLSELAEGQIREGTVRNILDFGAFVDLGGVDGLLHISQLSWQRVKHPSEVLTLGQPIKVKIRSIDEQTGKISLAFRDMLENPWESAAYKYPVGLKVQGVVSKLMDFGAFVQLEPGIEGLIHISELAHGRVWRASDIVKEGDEVEVKILKVEPENQRIGLSLKACAAKPESAQAAEPEPEPEPEVAAPPVSQKPGKPLKGGLRGKSGGEAFGLKW